MAKSANRIQMKQYVAEKIDKDILESVSRLKLRKSFGDNYLSKLKDFDIIFKSPSCRPDLPEIVSEVERGAKLTSEIELVLELSPCKIIAVTGSDGKTTTTSLIAATKNLVDIDEQIKFHMKGK